MKMALHEFNWDKNRWKEVLPLVLSYMNLLLCTSTNETPHKRFLKFQRHSCTGTFLPEFPTKEGTTVLDRKRQCLKGDVSNDSIDKSNTCSSPETNAPNPDVDTIIPDDLQPTAEENSD